MSTVKHAVIAAAGLGTRMGRGRPKCLEKIRGRAIIDYQLALLGSFEDVRVIVGFQESEVMEHVRRIRPDVVFVRNSNFRNTTTLQSFWLGVQGLTRPCLIMDADIVFEPASFQSFITDCHDGRSRIGITPARTEDAVFVTTTGDISNLMVSGFDREHSEEYEWANLAHLRPEQFANKDCYVFEHLAQQLPLQASVIEAYEVDTPNDLARVEQLLTTVENRANRDMWKVGHPIRLDG